MYFLGTRIKDHFLDLATGGTAHNRIVDKNHPLALDQGAVDVELEATPMLRICSVGSMKVRPIYWLRMIPIA